MSKFVFQKNFDIFVTFETVVLVFFKCARQQQLIKKVLNVPPPKQKGENMGQFSQNDIQSCVKTAQ